MNPWIYFWCGILIAGLGYNTSNILRGINAKFKIKVLGYLIYAGVAYLIGKLAHIW